MGDAGAQEGVMEQCWRASIPVQLRLAESEVTAVEQPPVLYFLVPRHSYLLSLLPKALPLLQHVLPPGEDTPWVDHESLPLKWNVPAGVLYDLLAGEGELPWSLTLHLRGYPQSVLPAYEGETALRGSLLNSLKEAAFICRGSSLRVMEMAPGAQEDLYRSVVLQDLRRYRSILQSMQLVPVARGARQPAIPLRVFLRSAGRGYLSSYEGVAYTSRSAECQRADGSLPTLGDVLLPLVAEFAATAAGNGGGSKGAPAAAPAGPAAAAAVEASTIADEAAPVSESTETAEQEGGSSDAGGGGSKGAEEGESGAAGPSPAAAPAQPAQAAGAGPGPGREPQELLAEVLVGGVSPPLDTPVAWLHANMHAADYFLYVVAHVQA